MKKKKKKKEVLSKNNAKFKEQSGIVQYFTIFQKDGASLYTFWCRVFDKLLLFS